MIILYFQLIILNKFLLMISGLPIKLFATYIFDSGNLILCNLIVYLIYRKIKIDAKIFCLLILTSFTPFLFNSQLIPLSTFPDQGTYISDASEFRNAFLIIMAGIKNY